MNRFILNAVIVVTCALPLAAQTQTDKRIAPCNLQLDRAPELRGFRLGTPQAAVLARFPGTSVGKPDELGLAELRMSIVDLSAVPKGLARPAKPISLEITGNDSTFVLDGSRFPILKGVRKIRLQFVDGKLAAMTLGYDDSINWNSVDEFVNAVSNALNLPGGWRRAADASENVKELRCEGFVLTGLLSGDSTDSSVAAQLTAEDLAATKLVEQRQKDLKAKAQQAEDAKRKNFKP